MQQSWSGPTAPVLLSRKSSSTDSIDMQLRRHSQRYSQRNDNASVRGPLLRVLTSAEDVGSERLPPTPSILSQQMWLNRTMEQMSPRRRPTELDPDLNPDVSPSPPRTPTTAKTSGPSADESPASVMDALALPTPVTEKLPPTATANDEDEPEWLSSAATTIQLGARRMSQAIFS